LKKDVLENHYIDIGKQVINQEASALLLLAGALGDSFTEAVQFIYSRCHQGNGKIVISGIGKSGHVSKKIVATFASTGSPAFFIHPAEASHGDMGIISEEDVIILISYSGESVELSGIINYAHRRNIPIVSITGAQDSTLGRYSDVVLLLPKVPEACPMGLAPTTSTTMAMALGDALAVALMEKTGFSRYDFSMFHPGGSLGQQLKTIESCMHKGKAIPLIGLGTLMDQCIIKMTQSGFGCVGVVDSGDSLVGIITDGDLRRHMNPYLLSKTVDDVMTKNPITIFSDLLIVDALSLFEKKAITNLFVVDENNRPIGILNLHDCLKQNGI